MKHVLIAQIVTLRRQFRVLFRPEDHLPQPLAVAQVEEDHPAVIARRVHPAAKRDRLADV